MTASSRASFCSPCLNASKALDRCWQVLPEFGSRFLRRDAQPHTVSEILFVSEKRASSPWPAGGLCNAACLPHTVWTNSLQPPKAKLHLPFPPHPLYSHLTTDVSAIPFNLQHPSYCTVRIFAKAALPPSDPSVVPYFAPRPHFRASVSCHPCLPSPRLYNPIPRPSPTYPASHESRPSFWPLGRRDGFRQRMPYLIISLVPPQPMKGIDQLTSASATQLFASLLWNLFLLSRLSFTTRPLGLSTYLTLDFCVWAIIAGFCTTGLIFSNTVSWGRYESIDCANLSEARKTFSCQPGFRTVQDLELGGIFGGWILRSVRLFCGRKRKRHRGSVKDDRLIRGIVRTTVPLPASHCET